MTAKTFNTSDVLSICTARLIGTMGGIHEIMNHFYPGIMTLGVAMMLQTAQHEIERQHPELKNLPPCTKENCLEFKDQMLDKFGLTMELAGPHGTGNPDMMENSNAH